MLARWEGYGCSPLESRNHWQTAVVYGIREARMEEGMKRVGRACRFVHQESVSSGRDECPTCQGRHPMALEGRGRTSPDDPFYQH